MLRKTAVILTMLLCSVATQVYALGLGSVAVESALNQPLRVRIEIIQLGDTRLQDVTVQMASTDDFERFNIDRLGFLTNIRFSVESSPQGNYVILISSQIVREPYLSFVLDTRWPSGRLLSEHTILLDLPVFDDQQTGASVRQPISPILQVPDTVQPAQPFVEPAPQDLTPPVTPPVITAPVTTPAIIEPEVIEPEVIEPEVIEPEVIEELTTPPTELADEPEPVIEETAEPAVQPQAEEEQVAAVEPEAEPVIDAEDPVITEAEDPVVAEEVPEPEVEEPPAPQIATEVLAEEVDEPVEAEPEVAVDASAEPDPEDAEPETIETTATDTLSDIALQVRPDNSVSMQQTMIAIQELNPDSFNDGNINGLRSGEVLRVPTLAEIQTVDPRVAIDEVDRQNQQFADAEPLVAASTTEPPQDDQQQGQLSIVSTDGDAIDASSGAGVLDDAENAELDRRIAELENQLALQQEEADRARIERDDLDSRMELMESQIIAAQEIIVLQDLQLAQLQESLAEAAAEAAQAAESAATLAAAQVEVAQPVDTPSSLFDDVLRILTGNTLMMIFGVVLVILLLVVLMLRRNRAAKADDDDDELDELAEKEFDDASDEGGDEPDTAKITEVSQDSESADLDDELDAIISDGDEKDEGADDISAEDIVEGDSLSQADTFVQSQQFDEAIAVLQSALAEAPEDTELGLKLLEVFAAQGDLAAFEVQADELTSLNDAELNARANELRTQFESTEAPDEFDLTEEPEATESVEELAEPEEAASFLDDLGIDLDAFDDDDAALDEEEDTQEEATLEVDIQDEENLEVDIQQDDSQDAAETATEDSSVADDAMESFEPDEMGITFDLGGETEDGEVEEAGQGGVESSDELGALDFSVEEPDADVEVTTEPEEVAEEVATIEMDTVSLDADDTDSAVESSTEASDEIESVDEENAVEFDFNKEDIKAESDDEAEEQADELKTFDFDMDAGSEDTLVEAPEAVESTDDIEGVSFDIEAPEVADAESESKQATDDDDYIDLDAETGTIDEATATTETESSEAAEVEIDLDEDIEIAIDEETVEDSEVAKIEEEENLDDLEFLSEEDEVEIESVADIEEVGMLSDSDEVATKLELAYAYHKMGDVDGAKEILQEVITEGSEEQVTKANELLSTLEKDTPAE